MTSASRDHCEHNDDLRWSALLYVLGELPGEEAAAFEARLEIDQAAREAVAEAVLLSETLYEAQAEALPASPVASGESAPGRGGLSGRRRVHMVLAIAAVCVLLIGALLGTFQSGGQVNSPDSLPLAQNAGRSTVETEPSGSPARTAGVRASLLIELWSRSSEVWGDAISESSDATSDDLISDDLIDEELAAEIAGSESSDLEAALGRAPRSELTVPGWMLAAVAETEILDNGTAPPSVEEN